jgi:hypothetical protein
MTVGFTFGGRKYVNNAIILAHLLEYLGIKARNIELRFRRPLTTQANFVIDNNPVEGHAVGEFTDEHSRRRYFAYQPTDLPLEESSLSADDVYHAKSMLNLCYYVAATCQNYCLDLHSTIHGPLASNEQSIVTGYSLGFAFPIYDALRRDFVPYVELTSELQGNARYLLHISLNGVTIGHRTSIIKEFKL